MKFNLKGALTFTLLPMTVLRCPYCGSPFCGNVLPFLLLSGVIGGFMPSKRQREKGEKPIRG
jgi:hypothetical protein